jgi:hypothetical protein
MALQHLSAAEMIEISNLWLTEPSLLEDGKRIPGYRLLLKSVDMLAVWISPLEKAHEALISFLKKTPSHDSPEVTEIEAEQARLDLRFDSINRFLYPFLELLRELVTPETQAVLAPLRQRLYPNALQVNKYKYEREAGEARLIEGRLSPEDKVLLASLSITFEKKTVTMLALLEEMIEKGKRLGDLEKLRQDLLKRVAPAVGPTERDVLNNWINRATTFERTIETALEQGDITPEFREEILGHRFRIEAEAQRRYFATKEPPKEPTPPPSESPKTED